MMTGVFQSYKTRCTASDTLMLHRGLFLDLVKFDGFVIICVEYDPYDKKKTVFMQNLNLDFFL